MYFKEPKVEFVSVDLEMVIATSPACDANVTKKGSVETCTGYDAPSNSCKYNNTFMADSDIPVPEESPIPSPIPDVPADESITTM